MGGFSWPAEATTDPDTIRRMWTAADGSSNDYNIGLAMGRGFAAIDADCKPKLNADKTPKLDEQGRQMFGTGVKTLEQWDMFDELPKGYRQTTASGGVHVILALPEDAEIGNSSSKIADDVDVRGRNGLIVGAGSTIDGKAYVWEGGKREEMPAEFVRRCGAPRERAKDSKVPLVELDKPQNIERAKQYLTDDDGARAWYAEGASRYAVACQLKDLGVSVETCFELMAEHWNYDSDFDRLQEKIEHAYEYGLNRPGSADPAAEFSDDEGLLDVPLGVSPYEPSAPSKSTGAVRRGTLSDLSVDTDFKPPPELVRDTIPDGGVVGFIAGQSGALKTFVALELAVCLATGEDFAGRKVERTGGVVFAAFEGEGTIRGRLKARRSKLDDPLKPLPITALTGFGSIASVQDYQAFGDEIVRAAADMKGRNGAPLVAVVVDTVAAAGMILEDRENDPAAWQAVFNGLRPIARRIGAPIILVHHYGRTPAPECAAHPTLALVRTSCWP